MMITRQNHRKRNDFLEEFCLPFGGLPRFYFRSICVQLSTGKQLLSLPPQERFVLIPPPKFSKVPTLF